MSKKKVSVFGDRLRGLQDQAADAMANYTPGGVRVPDSIYLGKESAELRESASSGKLMVARQFVIAEGECAGLAVWDNLVIENNDTGIQICRRWIEMHGYEWPEEDLGSIEEIVNEINEKASMVRFKVKTTKDKNDDTREYTNVSVLSIEDGSGTEGSEEQPEEQPEEQSDEGVDLSSMSRSELKQFIKDNQACENIRVTVKMTDDEIRDLITDAIADADDENEENEGTDDNAEQIDAICTFASSQGVEGIDTTMELDAIVEVLSGYGFVSNEITEEEKELLISIGLEGNIQEPAKKAPAKVIPKAPAKVPPKVAPKVPIKAPPKRK